MELFLEKAGGANPENVCELPLSVDEVSSRTGFLFEDYLEDGLGPCSIALCVTEEGAWQMQGFGSRASKSPGVVVKFRITERDPELLLRHVLQLLEVAPQELLWLNEKYKDFKV